jgi:hypothetical protein
MLSCLLEWPPTIYDTLAALIECGVDLHTLDSFKCDAYTQLCMKPAIYRNTTYSRLLYMLIDAGTVPGRCGRSMPWVDEYIKTHERAGEIRDKQGTF